MDGFDFSLDPAINPILLRLAGYKTAHDASVLAGVRPAHEKTAIVPAGGGGLPPGGPPPGDPAAGGAPAQPPGGAMAPPPGPPPGGADPQMVQDVAMQLMQMMQGGGGAGGAGGPMGKPGKKAEQAITDAKLYAIDVKLTAIMNHLQIQMPPEATLGTPPDPMAQQAAGQDHAMASGVASNPDSAAGAGAGGGAGGGGLPPLPAGLGPPGKAAGAIGIGSTWPAGAARPVAAPSAAARMRGLLGV